MSNTIDIVAVPPRGARALQREFVQFPHRLYAGDTNWVPYFNIDMYAMLRRKHPYFATYPAEFLIAQRDGKTVGTICVAYNQRYVDEHNLKAVNFYFLEMVDNIDVADALFEAAIEWGRQYGIEEIIGPLLSGGASGSGMLIEGFDHPAPMTMMRYNPPYYPTFIEELGFKKFFDLNSLFVENEQIKLTDRLRSIAAKVEKRGNFSIMHFKSKRHFRQVAQQAIPMYNELLGDHLENYPLTSKEINHMLNDVMPVARIDLIKVLLHKGKIAGFFLVFPNASKALQRSKGRITPRTLLDVSRSIKRYDEIILNGVGVLPEYQRLGGTALLYLALERALDLENMKKLELTQIAESTTLMLAEALASGGQIAKRHRVYRKRL